MDVQIEQCVTCGAAMVNREKHQLWHQQIDARVERLQGRINRLLRAR